MILQILGIAVLAGIGRILWFLIRHWNKYIGRDNRNKYFADFCKDFPILHNEKVLPMKKKLFEPLQTLESKFPELRKKKALRILEIGVGSGANFEFYPNTSLIAVDPNKFFKEYLMETLEKHPNVELERYICGGAENMRDVPDESVDVVVSTLVLCSISDLKTVWKEIRRVLVPGGNFYFMEHVVDDKTSWLQFKQRFWGSTGLWPFLVDGCRPDKDIASELNKGDFSKVSVKRFRMDVSDVPSAVKYLEPHIMGFCCK